MNDLEVLRSAGLQLPSPAYLFGAILFGIIGYAAYRYGKKAALPYPRWIGVVLMLYPYAISRTWALYLAGGALCILLYLFRA
jgi:hypothetical protein